MNKLNFPLDKISKNNIADLHTALKKLNLDVVDDEISNKRMGESTVKAIKDIQMKSKLPVNGKLNEKTIEVLNA